MIVLRGVQRHSNRQGCKNVCFLPNICPVMKGVHAILVAVAVAVEVDPNMILLEHCHNKILVDSKHSSHFQM